MQRLKALRCGPACQSAEYLSLCVQLDQLKQLRMWGSVTPGHPERQVADGIEVTTGVAFVPCTVRWCSITGSAGLHP